MDDIEMQVRTIVGHHTVVSNDPHATWGEIGVDSLALAQIHYETEDKLGVRIIRLGTPHLI